ncbi:porin OmpA [Aeromonas dhakensis]|uniref:porin OmpA n=2 Tax=Aeromonas dhakensis TaxID=196024 RepID=UPI000345439B|nr:porin OmpA [Aeromonas dhakensis]KMK92226.1 membrane protein [Aeromonas enteropelogenes]ASX13358.1 porin OmpA [Aeromonas dhakensis]EIM1708388.1 porin OmpA [Aeromonas dhakensis]MBL0526478.1 porin OmpA [Aeromonas dhakensis]MBL0637036.1 porin OmpA [Aeromonas dhakensis]
MNKTLITLLVSGLLAANAQAAGQDNTWYGGAKLGWSNFYGVDHNQDIKDNYAISEEDKNDVGAGAFLGYQVNQNLGFELGYDWLGKYKYTATDKLDPTDIGRDEIKAQLAQLTMKIGMPVSDSLDLYTRLGGAYAWTDSKQFDNDNGAAFVGALGAEYAFNRDWAARLEYQYTTPLGDNSLDKTGAELDNGLLAVAVVYRFGQVAPVVAAPMPAPAPEPVMVDKQFTLSSDVLFDFNKATLKPAGGQALDNLYSQIEQARPKDGVATVIGYTDRIGSDAYNQKLSEQRARTVADYLVGKGLPADKVNVEGRGKGNPVTGDSCTSKSKRELIVCLAPDRRVEVKVEGISEVQQ